MAMIYTFYSYKGGVGRSMALANVAECFYEKGLRVLIVDWDLEAPGLESFFYEPAGEGVTTDQSDEAAAVRSRLGLIDMLLSYKQMYRRLPLAALPAADSRAGKLSTDPVARQTVNVDKVLDEHLPPLNDFVTPIHRDSSGRALWLLSAGWRQNRFSEYSRAVQSFNWDEFYGAFSGEAYFEWMRRQFNALVDVVLIDSRTGVTEMGGVCARQLADVVVSFCAPNFQNVDGVAKMVQSFRSSAVLAARKNRPIETLVIPTRIQNSELVLLGKFKELFHAQIETDPQKGLFVRIGQIDHERFQVNDGLRFGVGVRLIGGAMVQCPRGCARDGQQDNQADHDRRRFLWGLLRHNALD